MSISYQELHWESINFLKNYLYRRIASPMNNALGRLAIAQTMDNQVAIREQLRGIERNLEITLNFIKAWATLIYVQSGGTLHDSQRCQVTPEALPAWLIEYLGAKTVLRVEHTQPCYVQPEMLYEGLIILCQVGMSVGSLKRLITSDAKGSRSGVWIRAVFEPPKASPYPSLKSMIAGLDTDDPVERDLAIQLKIMGEMFKINRARFMLQNNTQSTEQALAALLPIDIGDEQPLTPALADEAARDSTHPVTEQPAAPDYSHSTLYNGLAHRLNNQPSGQEPTSDCKREADSPANVANNHTPMMAGPVMARTPREIEQPPASPPDYSAPDTTVHTIAGPVMAPTPRGVPQPAGSNNSKQKQKDTSGNSPEKSTTPDQSQPAMPDDIEIENESETLIIPPPDLKRRLKMPPDASPDKPSSDGDTPATPAVPDDKPGTDMPAQDNTEQLNG
ncbi:MAG: hypothetical protein JXJ20_09445 [Anaerolineae bacterium]|nr:hypothetical protein [Anaerolineae bacterium]